MTPNTNLMQYFFVGNPSKNIDLSNFLIPPTWVIYLMTPDLSMFLYSIHWGSDLPLCGMASEGFWLKVVTGQHPKPCKTCNSVAVLYIARYEFSPNQQYHAYTSGYMTQGAVSAMLLYHINPISMYHWDTW